MHGDPAEVHERLSRSAFTDALKRLGIEDAPETPDTPSVAESTTVPTPSQTPEPELVEASQQTAPEPSQAASLITPADTEFAEVVASLPLAPTASVNGRRKVAAASGPARRQARVTATVGVDRDEAARIWRESRDLSAPLSSRALAARTGMSQSTAARLIADIRAEDDQAAA
jgi:hypothetical protein